MATGGGDKDDGEDEDADAAQDSKYITLDDRSAPRRESMAEEMSGLQRLKMLAFEMQKDEIVKVQKRETDETTQAEENSISIPPKEQTVQKTQRPESKSVDVEARKLVILPHKELDKRAHEAEESMGRSARILEAIVSTSINIFILIDSTHASMSTLYFYFLT